VGDDAEGLLTAVRGPIRRSHAGDYQVRLAANERDVLRELPGQLRALLEAENPASDRAVARLFPPAYEDDPLRNLDYERLAGDDLLRGRLAAIETMDRTIDASRLSEDELVAWLAVINDLRLVLGTRLDVTEETTQADFPDSDPRQEAYSLYVYLTWFEDATVRSLGEPVEGS
jgi:hypothetical protein